MLTKEHIKDLRKHTLSIEELVDILEWFSDYDENSLYLVYTGNLNTNTNLKYIFSVDRYEINKHNITLYLTHIGKTNSVWIKKIPIASYNSGFADVDIIVELYEEEAYDIFLENHLNEYYKREYNILYKVEHSDEKTEPTKEKTVRLDIETRSDIEEFLNHKKMYIGDDKNMKNVRVEQILNVNTQAAKVAAQVTAGKTINTALIEKIKPQLPIMVRGYAETPIGAVVVANIVNYGVSAFASDNEKALWIADALMVAAMSEFIESFNVDKLVKELVDSVDVTIPTDIDDAVNKAQVS